MRGRSGQEAGQSTGTVFVTVKIGDILTQHGSEGPVSCSVDKSLLAVSECPAVEAIGQELGDGEYQVHQRPEVDIFTALAAV